MNSLTATYYIHSQGKHRTEIHGLSYPIVLRCSHYKANNNQAYFKPF